MTGQSEGYFPRGRSVLRQVHDERIVGLLYGQRGLMVGGVDPVVSTGTFEKSRGSATPFDRLARSERRYGRGQAQRTAAAMGARRDRVV